MRFLVLSIASLAPLLFCMDLAQDPYAALQVSPTATLAEIESGVNIMAEQNPELRDNLSRALMTFKLKRFHSQDSFKLRLEAMTMIDRLRRHHLLKDVQLSPLMEPARLEPEILVDYEKRLEGLLCDPVLTYTDQYYLAMSLMGNHLFDQLEVLVAREDFVAEEDHLLKALEPEVRSAKAFKLLFPKGNFKARLDSLLMSAKIYQNVEVIEFLIDNTDVNIPPTILNYAIFVQNVGLAGKILTKVGPLPNPEHFYISALASENPAMFEVLDNFYRVTPMDLESILGNILELLHRSKNTEFIKYILDWYFARMTVSEFSVDQLRLFSHALAGRKDDLIDFVLGRQKNPKLINMLIASAALLQKYDLAEQMIPMCTDPSDAFFHMLSMATDTDQKIAVLTFAQSIPAISCKDRMEAYERLLNGITDEGKTELVKLLDHETMSVDEMKHVAETDDLKNMTAFLPGYHLRRFSTLG